jgi:hypothetical protein
MFAEVTAGALPPMPTPFTGPFLAASGSRETGSIRRAFGPLRAVVPQLQTWVAPGMHHPWNQQDPELFTRMVLGIADTGVWRGEPSTH